LEGRGIRRRIWRSTALLAGGRLVGTASGAAVLLLLARRLPLAEFGRYTFYLAVFLLLESLVDLGTGATVVQRTAGRGDEPGVLAAHLAAGRRVRLGLAAAGAAAVATLAWAVGEPGAPWIALAAAYPLTRSLELSSVVFQNEIAWGRPVATRAGAALARLGAALALAAAGVRSAPPYLVAYAAGTAAGHVALHLLARPRLPRASAPPVRGLLGAAMPLGLAGLCQQAYVWVDNAFVRAIEGDGELGHYNACARLFSFLVLVPTYATSAALPWLAARARAGTGSAGLAGAIVRLARPLIIGGCLVAALAWPWAGGILRTLFGPGFEAAAPALRWLLAAAAVVHLGAVLLTAVVARGDGGAVLRITGAALLLNVVANAWAVPRHGIAGAAAATLLTELAIVLLAALALRRDAAPVPTGVA